VDDSDLTTRMADPGRLKALMASYQAGDLEAFDQLYALLVPAIRGFLRRRMIDAQHVDDLVQETFLQVHRARHTYDPTYPLLPWMLAIARHVWLMYMRASARRLRPSEQIEHLELGVRAEAEAYADRADLRAALGALSAEKRRPLLWHHVLGVSFREIAARLGIREDAAKLRSSRGIAQLRSRLRQSHAGERSNE
jgi:RNA polymerase sigma-70 factor (ECF subfamily)